MNRQGRSGRGWFTTGLYGLFAIGAIYVALSLRFQPLGEARERTDVLSRQAEERVLGRRVSWLFATLEGDTVAIPSAISNSTHWVLVALTTRGCRACNRMVEQIPEYFSRRPWLLSGFEVWHVSNGVSWPVKTPLGERLLVRELRSLGTANAARQLAVSYSPIAVLLDSQGVVRRVRVGYASTQGMQWLDSVLDPPRGKIEP